MQREGSKQVGTREKVQIMKGIRAITCVYIQDIVGYIVDSKKLEHGCWGILWFASGLGFQDGHVPTLWLLQWWE